MQAALLITALTTLLAAINLQAQVNSLSRSVQILSEHIAQQENNNVTK